MSLRLYSEIFRRNKTALAGLVVVCMLVLLGLFPWLFSPYDPRERGPPEEHFQPPSPEHPLGTDDQGRDVLSLLIHGTRTSLLVGVAASLLAVGLGTLVGLVSGYYGGLRGEALMRITDIFLILPTVPLMIVLAATLKPSIWNVALAIGVTSWTQTARVVRSQVLSLKERTFIHRAKVVGCSDMRIITRYILPFVAPLVLAQFILTIDIAIAAEAFLSFLGLGDLSEISWGTMLYFAFNFGAFTLGAYWYFLPPGIMIVATILSLSALSHGIEELVNPLLREV